ncbi:nucleotide sugar dehydrogenase [Candidatus Daviesbacteria bacterium]|nr:nucleotide sugar dehydrogenase [Candidatus Daviesbacteria bacterium]
MNKISKIAFVGLSHLGLVTSICTASKHSNVIGLDTDALLVSSLKKGKLPVYEPGLDKLLGKVEKRISFSNDFSQLASCDVVFFAQDTATDGSGSVDKLNRLVSLSLPYFKPRAQLIFISQVPVGYYRQLVRDIKKKKPKLKFSLYHWIDTLIMTQAIASFLTPSRIIIGMADPKKPVDDKLKIILNWFDCPVFYMSYESAEVTKAAINLYLATSVTYANTVADYCEAVGANIYEIIPALATDRRIGQFAYIRPGLKIAGGHLERDLLMLSRLAKKAQINSGVVDFIIKYDRRRFGWLKKQLNNHLLSKTKMPKICIWGLSYKPNSASQTGAISQLVIKYLKGKAGLAVYDPQAKLLENINWAVQYRNKWQALKRADCLIILTPWDEFKTVKISNIVKKMKDKLVIDPTGLYADREKELDKLRYFSLGFSNQDLSIS